MDEKQKQTEVEGTPETQTNKQTKEQEKLGSNE